MPLTDSKKPEINTTIDNILNIVAIGYYICLIAIGILIILMLIKKFTTSTNKSLNNNYYYNNNLTNDNMIVVELYKWIIVLYAVSMCITTGFIIARKKIPGSNVLNIIASAVIIVITFFVN